MRYFGLTGLATTAVFALGMSGAQATVAYDGALQNSDYYNGSGNMAADGNVHWSTDTENGVEIGLAAIQRFIGFYTPDAGTSTYHAATGQTTAAGQAGSTWGLEFSINTNTTGSSGFDPSNTTANLCMTDVGQGTSGCFDPFFIFDNTVTGGTLVQNSEPLSTSPTGDPSFAAFVLGDLGYDIDANDTYLFTLTLTDATTSNLLASIDTTVITGTGAPTATPEPATMALFGSALLGMGWLKRKRRKAGV